MNTPFFFREAEIFNADPRNLTCSLRYGDIGISEVFDNVPMPNLIGSGNSGFIANLMNGTRVIAAYLQDTSKEPVVIIAVLPSRLQKRDDYNELSSFLIDKNKGTQAYPKILQNGDSYASAHNGPFLWLKNDDSLHLSSRNGNGIFLIKNIGTKTHNLFSLSNNHSTEGSGGRLNWGRIKRSTNNVGWNTFKDFYTDLSRDSSMQEVGFWPANRISKINTPIGPRNPALSEYRLVINEFATEFGFSGIDRELFKNSSKIDAMSRSPSLSRDREPGNLLRLSEGELIEIVGGNLADINGVLLDINYNPIQYDASFPTIDFEKKFEEAARKSRRGIGYHFKLSTNIRSDDTALSAKDFVFDIDKEGVLKVNIPKSSTTGNIPYVTNVDFQKKGNGRILEVSSDNLSIKERIPVHSRDRDGNPTSTRVKNKFRATGIRFANTGDRYFPISSGGEKTIRINTTMHHNIYATAERLIANQISKIHIPITFANEKSLNIGGIDLGKVPNTGTTKADFSRHSVFEVVEDNGSDIKDLFYSAISIAPGSPAISTGGDTVVAGRAYDSDDKEQPLISNYFKTEAGDDGVKISSDLSGKTNVATHGGVSANVNMEGSLELSLGKDNIDGKSFILDMAGSLVAWFGKDKNNRSAIVQSDGDILVNIGGSYKTPKNVDDIPVMNTGRFDLRVNVVDKGFYDSIGNRKRDGGSYTDDAPYSSDYIISISEHGLVIAGMKADAPMVIRNDGPLMLESASGKLTLKGMSVETIEYGKLPTDDGRSKR